MQIHCRIAGRSSAIQDCMCVILCVYLGFAIYSGMVVQQEVCHLCISIVASYMQRSVTHLE